MICVTQERGFAPETPPHAAFLGHGNRAGAVLPARIAGIPREAGMQTCLPGLR